MEILFCSSPINPNEVDMDYQQEKIMAENNNINTALFSFDDLNNSNFEVALKPIQKSRNYRMAIYRGWMMKPEIYSKFYDYLLKKGVQLINSYDEYKLCHYLPENYPIIKNITPKSVWIENNGNLSIDRIMNLISVFDDKPLIIKDYVKSQKYYWKEACYISSAANRISVENVVTRFMKLQGENFEGGLVFRKYIDFESIGIIQKATCHLR